MDSALPDNPAPEATAKVRLSGPEWELEAHIRVPLGPARLERLLPALHGLANTMVDSVTEAVEQEGQRITCRAGCGACCRQLVPIAAVEAYRIAALVAGLPEPQRTQTRQRFDAAAAAFERAGMLESLLHPESLPAPEVAPFAIRYFQQGVACPFLEAESCSIHPDRPIVCREYLVTSPAENCGQIPNAAIDRVPMPLKVSLALMRTDRPAEAAGLPAVDPAGGGGALGGVASRCVDAADRPGVAPRVLRPPDRQEHGGRGSGVRTDGGRLPRGVRPGCCSEAAPAMSRSLPSAAACDSDPPETATPPAGPAGGVEHPYDAAFWKACLANFLVTVALATLYRYADFIALLGGTNCTWAGSSASGWSAACRCGCLSAAGSTAMARGWSGWRPLAC